MGLFTALAVIVVMNFNVYYLQRLVYEPFFLWLIYIVRLMYGLLINKFIKMEYKKRDWENYRQLKKGEVIKDTDEFLEDKKGWRKTICGGGLAPDPQFTSHRMYRRLKTDV
jgi:hypothetical protein